MKPIHFEQANVRLTGPQGENDPNVSPMDANFNNGIYTSCWELTNEDIEELKRTKKLYIMIMVGNMPPPPINAQVFDPFIKNALGYCILPYEIVDSEGKGTGKFITIWNSRDGSVMNEIMIDGEKYRLNTNIPNYEPRAILAPNSDMLQSTKYMFRDMTDQEIEKMIDELLTQDESKWPRLVGKDGEPMPIPRNKKAYLQNALCLIPKIDLIPNPEPKFEKGGTGFDGENESSNDEAIIKSMPKIEK